ncbi:hypothetical protein GBA52_008658 [Prunus armeniaca]|nr:hypothetical protein GBA52_008658 [Prunus armeniaca]
MSTYAESSNEVVDWWRLDITWVASLSSPSSSSSSSSSLATYLSSSSSALSLSYFVASLSS